MPIQVISTASLICTFGMAPSTLNVLPVTGVTCSKLPAATIMDHIPMTNIMPFGACITPSNPQVAAATAAALGVLTPQPCIPATTTPWTPGGITVTHGKMVALDNASMCMCMWGGVITVTFPGQVQTTIP